MPNTCSAPGCKAGYKPSKKRKKTDGPDDAVDDANNPSGDDDAEEKISLFSFPSHDSAPERRARWISRVPRDEWHPGEKAKIFLCEKHFHASDIITDSIDSNSRRKKTKQSKLCHKRLKDDAVPCIWPTLPGHLTKIVTPRPTTLASSESRQENTKRLIEDNQ